MCLFLSIPDPPFFPPSPLPLLLCSTLAHYYSPLPLNVMSGMTKSLASVPLNQLLPHFELHLAFIKHALAHPHINPVVSPPLPLIPPPSHPGLSHCSVSFFFLQVLLRLLTKVLSHTSVCAQGVWGVGNTLTEVCTTVMRVHPTQTVFNGKILLEKKTSSLYVAIEPFFSLGIVQYSVWCFGQICVCC